MSKNKWTSRSRWSEKLEELLKAIPEGTEEYGAYRLSEGTGIQVNKIRIMLRGIWSLKKALKD